MSSTARITHTASLLVVVCALLLASAVAVAQEESGATPGGGDAASPGGAASEAGGAAADSGGSGGGAEGTGGGDADLGALTGDAPAVDPLFELEIPLYEEIQRAPVAVVEPTNVGEGSVDGVGDGIEKVIRRDLEISGLFEVTSASTYGLVDLKRDGVTVSTIDFDGWYTVGVALLVKGTYAKRGDKVEIDLRLFDVDTGQAIDLKWSPTTVGSGGYTEVAHDFVNAIIEYYTGERGVFGSRILFTGPDTGNHRRIYSVDNAGFGLGAYDVPPGINVLPTWGPGGAVLYTALADEGDDIYQFQKGEVERLTESVGFASGADYCSSAGVIALTINGEDGTDIWTMKKDGSELVNLTNSPEVIETSPSWGPGCKKMAYVSDESGRPQIYLMNADGSSPKRLTWLGNYNTTPAWSPKGDVVAFTARDERRRFDIFTVSVGDGFVTRLTQDQGNNEEPTWSPDGRYLAFQSTRDGKQPRLYVMTADGRWQTRISDMPGARTPTWQR